MHFPWKDTPASAVCFTASRSRIRSHSRSFSFHPRHDVFRPRGPFNGEPVLRRANRTGNSGSLPPNLALRNVTRIVLERVLFF